MPNKDHTAPEVRYHILEDIRFRIGSDGSTWTRATHNGFIRRDGIWRPLKPQTNKRGYQSIKFGRWKRFRLHSLVLECFVGPRPPGMECRHLDGNPSNNALENLAWGTRSENRADQVRHGTAHWLLESNKKHLEKGRRLAKQRESG
jgi:HNH endonuclease